MSIINDLWLDVRQSCRLLMRHRLVTATIVLMLATSIAANTIAFDVIDRLLLSTPRHVSDPARVVRLYSRYTIPGQEVRNTDVVSYPDLTTLRSDTLTYAAVSASRTTGLSLDKEGVALPVRAQLVSGNYFTMLGIRAERGRLLMPDDDYPPAGELVVVLSHKASERWFGGTNPVGKTVRLDGRPLVVVGVAPKGFLGVDYASVDCWVPISTFGNAIAGSNWDLRHSVRWLQIIARLRDGVSPTLAMSRATQVLYPVPETAVLGAESAEAVWGPLSLARGPRGNREATVSIWLTCLSAALLLIACANAVNLLLARALARAPEVALRVALGVTRYRLFRQFCVESAVLTVLAGGVALGLTYVGASLSRKVLLAGIDFPQSPLRSATLAYVCFTSLLVALITGLSPAVFSIRRLSYPQLHGSPHSPHRRGIRLRSALTMLQVALAGALLYGAVLFTKSLENARSAELGVNVDHVIVARMLSRPPEGGNTRWNADYEEAAARIARLGGVMQAGVASSVPFLGHSMARIISTPGWNSLERLPDSAAYISSATASYFTTMGIPVLAGTLDSTWGGSAAQYVAVVNETFARSVWPEDRAVGKCLQVYGAGPACRNVVAVMGDTRLTDLRDRPQPEVWVPLGEMNESPVLFARTRTSVEEFVGSVEREIRAVDHALPYIAVETLPDLMAPQMRSWRLGSVLLGAFASFAILMACMGVFAVAAHEVVQRRKEIGIRVALGASPSDVARMILGQNAIVVASGAAGGLLVAWTLSPMLAPLLLEVEPRDAGTVCLVLLVLGVVGTAACLFPAFSAARDQTADVLRES